MLYTLVQRSRLIKVSAGSLAVFGTAGRVLLRGGQRRKRGSDLGGPKVRVLDQLADFLHPDVLRVKIVRLQDDL